MFPPPFFDGWILQPDLREKVCLSEDAQSRFLAFGAGERWSDIVQWTLEQGWGGLENLTDIPGTVGAAPVQNIGAYGVELASVFHSLEVWDRLENTSYRLNHKACCFGYRESIFKREAAYRQGRFVITRVVLRLAKNWMPQLGYKELREALHEAGRYHPTPQEISETVRQLRQHKLPDPAIFGNAGSFFKNPVVPLPVADSLQAAYPQLPVYPQADDGDVKLAAGWLIEQAGWKGRRLGPVGMFERQALVMVRFEAATVAHVLALQEAVSCEVLSQFGVELYPEPVFF